jgi:polysaccharide export outer membrane protein
MVLLVAALLLLPAFAAGAEVAAYRIGPGDVVDVQVWREADLSGSHRVDEEGLLRHVLAGAIPAAGKTCDGLAEELRALLEKDYLREARVIVTLEASARRKAWILGAVEKPGRYPVAEGTRLLDLVFAAGGLADRSDGRATFYRMGELRPGESVLSPAERTSPERFEVDLTPLLAGDLVANSLVAAGDVLVVSGAEAVAGQAAARHRVRVVGEVERPGAYPISEAPTALDAVLAAGGFTEFASSNRARLVRGEGDNRTVQRLELGDIVRGRDGAANIALEDGDLIVIPEALF